MKINLIILFLCFCVQCFAQTNVVFKTINLRNAPAEGSIPFSSGTIYYNESTNLFRVNENGVWKNITDVPTWGSITGTLSNQTDLQTVLDGKWNTSGNTTLIGNPIVTADGSAFGSLTIQNTNGPINQTVFWDAGGLSLSSSSGAVRTTMLFSHFSGITITDNTLTPRGITGAADYSANYTDLTYTQRGYVDSNINGKSTATIDALNTNTGPGATEDGYAFTWNNTADEYVLTNIDALYAPISGSANYIPTSGNIDLTGNLVVEGGGSNYNVQFGATAFPPPGDIIGSFTIRGTGNFSHQLFSGNTILSRFINDAEGFEFSSNNSSGVSLIDFTTTHAPTASFGDRGRIFIQTRTAGSELVSFMDIGQSAGGQDVTGISFGASDVGSFRIINSPTAATMDITDNRTGSNAVGLQYTSDLTSNFTTRSLVDRGYTDARYLQKDANGVPTLPSFTVVGLPSAVTSGAGAMVYVSDETGGGVPAFSDGTNWRRVTDRAIVQ